ncbi:hypothetical protein HPB47_011452 [Ixodes persulcatus]|uniref:Uncharacterized protein n=1 Tax=Ixodes persulcatus TaxID=34615 RepID=A0AC60NW80_IXOPE|nr:hypothetical protein HPB47_011452 [Ixodes persulcatus]
MSDESEVDLDTVRQSVKLRRRVVVFSRTSRASYDSGETSEEVDLPDGCCHRKPTHLWNAPGPPKQSETLAQHDSKTGYLCEISYDDDLKCISGVVQAGMRYKSLKLEGFATRDSLTLKEPLSRWNFYGIHQLPGFPEDGPIDGKFLGLLHYESKLARSAITQSALGRGKNRPDEVDERSSMSDETISARHAVHRPRTSSGPGHAPGLCRERQGHQTRAF